MTPTYCPILKAKQGEFDALSHLNPRVAKKTLPLFEISRLGEKMRNGVRFQGVEAVTCAYLDETAENIAKVWKGRSALVDAFQWPAHSKTETGEHILPYIYNKLNSLGVDTVPVIGYDRWESKEYRLAIQGLKTGKDDYVCLRLDSHAIEDSADPEFFEERILEILNDLSIEPARCGVLIDFGDICITSLDYLIEQSCNIVLLLENKGFKYFTTAGCSLPSSIDKAVNKSNSSGKVIRKEMLLWQALKKEYPHITCKFGDYGVRGPNSAEDVIAPDANGKIRYTIELTYHIERGHSMRTGDKGAQMYTLSRNLIESSHYKGEDFSWGDLQIQKCSDEEFRGNSTTWIAIDTNHHMTWVVAEILEFETSHAAISIQSA
jgi:hypothetical protein